MNYQEALQIMGLQEGYSEAELKKAYRDLVKKYHPDLNHAPDAEEQMRRINEAHDYLNGNKVKKTQIRLTHRSIFDIVRA